MNKYGVVIKFLDGSTDMRIGGIPSNVPVHKVVERAQMQTYRALETGKPSPCMYQVFDVQDTVSLLLCKMAHQGGIR